jgi:hypothetical protein
VKIDVARRFLACFTIKKTEVAGGWLNCSCPLAPWTHAKGHDHQPSFGLNVESGRFNCFSCGASGSLSYLASTVLAFLQQTPERMGLYDFKTAYEILDGAELDFESLPDFTEFDPQQVFEPWPEWWLDMFEPVALNKAASAYLAKREVPPSLQVQMELRWDSVRDMVVCPYRTAFGKFAGARGRCIDPSRPKNEQHHDYKYKSQNNSKLIWYNEQALQNDGPIIVVEGQFDVMHLLQVTPNVVGNLTAKIPWPKLTKLSAKDTVIFMPDNDPPGMMAVYGNDVYPGAVKLLGNLGPTIAVLEYPAEFEDPDKVPLEWLRKELSGIVPLLA